MKPRIQDDHLSLPQTINFFERYKFREGWKLTVRIFKLKIIALCLLVVSLLITTISASPVFTSFPNAKKEKNHRLAGEETKLVTSFSPQNKKGQRATFVEVIGDVSHYQYNIKNTSSLAVYENYLQAFKEAGLEISYSCSNQDCGTKKAQEELSDLAAYFRSGNHYRKARYIYAQSNAEHPLAVSLFVGQYKSTAKVMLSVVKKQPVTTGLITANVEAFDNQPNNSVVKPARADVRGSSDHSLLTRYPGSYIQGYEQLDYDEISLATGISNKKKVAAPAIDVIGDITRFTYIIRDVSTLKIYRNYLGALVKEGFETVFSCEKAKCGKYVREIGNQLAVANNVYNAYHHPRYLLMKNIEEGVATYVALFVGDYQAKAYIQLAIVRTESLQKGLITSNSAQIQKQLEQQGKASIYGIFFDYDKASVTEASKPALDEISKLLNKNKQLKLYVVGHTDDKGSTDYNIKLSSRRAAAVVANLVGNYGIAKNRLSAYGVGPYSPAASNSSEYGRQLNRRVELVVKLDQ